MLQLTASRWIGAIAAMVALGLAPGAAWAGPPYLTDDPEPTDPGHWEIYNFVQAAGAGPSLAGEAGFDINYGPAPNLQLTAVLPLGFEGDHGVAGDGFRGGAQDVQLAVKWRFLQQADGSWAPDVSVFPRLFVNTASHAFSTGGTGLLLPIWAEKDYGPWSVFGGGGWQFNPGPGQRDFWQGGVTVARQVAKPLSLGMEYFAQTRSEVGGGEFKTVDLGLDWQAWKHWSLLAETGPTWDTGGPGGWQAYLALKADY